MAIYDCVEKIVQNIKKTKQKRPGRVETHFEAWSRNVLRRKGFHPLCRPGPVSSKTVL